MVELWSRLKFEAKNCSQMACKEITGQYEALRLSVQDEGGWTDSPKFKKIIKSELMVSTFLKLELKLSFFTKGGDVVENNHSMLAKTLSPSFLKQMMTTLQD